MASRSLAFVALLVIAVLGIGSVASAQAVCATCAPLKDSGNPVNDLCTQVLVTWQRNDPGDCTFNPNPKCLPHVNCLFSMTVVVVDHGCGALYWSKFCTRSVDVAGLPIGGELCGDPSPFANPTIVADWPVPCGRQDSLKYERVLNGVTQVIAHTKATCTACPAMVATEGN